MYLVRKLKIGKSPQIDELELECGRVYSQTVIWFWRFVRRYDLWVSPATMMRFITSDKIHAHTADACVQAFFNAMRTWKAARKTNPTLKPPYRRKKFYQITYKSSAIRLRDGKLILSNGKGNPSLILDWRWEPPKQVTIHWDGEQYEAIAVYFVPPAIPVTEGRTVAADLGEVHFAGISDGWLVNGRYLRSLRRLQNKTVAKFQQRMSRKQKGSRRQKRLRKAKARALRKIRRKVTDFLHKVTTGIVNTLKREGCKTLVVGNLVGLRTDNDKGGKTNQKIHQWAYHRTTWFLRYKSERVGLGFALEGEEYTSQDCPLCGGRHKPDGRNFRCPKYGLVGHRDIVGAGNILRKYLGAAAPPSVGGLMARPFGVRFHPHIKVARGFILRETNRVSLMAKEAFGF